VIKTVINIPTAQQNFVYQSANLLMLACISKHISLISPFLTQIATCTLKTRTESKSPIKEKYSGTYIIIPKRKSKEQGREDTLVTQ